ncbi:GNAT family N-acetyltransferase [Microbacterium sediminis]|uniref:Acetyltransferase n=1 Tax=Microbacterium sediminis TaxID=904291 RepID=A0A1B9N9B0_9MICO|nr:GNAT family N-acetyltransferase [Microbacterium sediminis]OCG73183.1 acetyltransferase [Microbacterium sediminis]QBR74531.1 GNAT family N-acetyltransferase [Microbacterium sediminis]
MVEITTRPATLREWDDVQAALTGGGDGASCQCAWPLLPNAEWRSTGVDERREMLRGELRDGPPPGLVAYVDGAPAGWVRIGPRPAQRRLARSRVVRASPEPLDDGSVWAITCFSVRREHRRLGLNAALLEAAVAYAREQGARAVEAYPIDNTAAKPATNDLYVGALTTFLAAGFTVLGRPTPTRATVSLTLT